MLFSGEEVKEETESVDEVIVEVVVEGEEPTVPSVPAVAEYDEETMDRIQQLWGMGFNMSKEEAVDLLKKNNNSVSRIVNTMFD